MKVIGRRWTPLGLFLLALGAATASAQADGDPNRRSPAEGRARANPTPTAEGRARANPTDAIHDVARALAEMITPHWEGPRVRWPDPEPRPPSTEQRSSRFRPLVAHAGARVDDARLEAALDALEIAYDGLRALGYEPPYPDGGRGGDARFDLYLAREPSGARGAADDAITYAALDGLSSYAIVDPQVSPERFSACITEAYAEAILLGLDPAESPALRRATAAFLAYLMTGRFGCGEGVSDMQRAPGGSPLFHAADGGEGGALTLLLLSERHDGGTGAFVHALWEVTRQKTWDTGDLHALPDLERALERSLERAGHDLRSTMIDFAVARYFFRDRALIPAAEGGAGATQLHIEPEWRFAYAALPAHPPPSEAPIARFGSGYAEVDVRDAPVGSRLRVWSRGEQGVDWSLVAVTLDPQGRERGRVMAPPSPDPRRSYLAVELTPDIERVVLVVTNLGPTNARPEEEVERRFRLIVDGVTESEGASAVP